MKTCAKCGLDKPIDDFRLCGGKRRKELGHRRSTCKHCEWRASYKRRSAGTIAQSLRLRIRSQRTFDRKHGVEFDITIDDLMQLYERQHGRCAITGLSMVASFKDLKAISIDRIDNERGHVKGNVQLVCQWVNLARKDHTTDELNAVLTEYRGLALVTNHCDNGESRVQPRIVAKKAEVNEPPAKTILGSRTGRPNQKMPTTIAATLITAKPTTTFLPRVMNRLS